MDNDKIITKENFMRSKILSAVVLVVAVSALAATNMQPLNTRLGLWEVTTTVTTQGAMPIPADMLARLTPEQRARMEERMKASSAGTTRTTTHKECMTKEKQEKGETFSDNKACKVTILTSTSSRLDAKMTCNIQGMNSEGTIEVEALSPESVKGTTHAVLSGNHTMHVDSKFTSKWLGSSCGSVK